MTEGFNDITSLPGWFMKNNSSPLGTIGWFQGNTTVFSAQAGPANSYIAANFNNTSGTGTISDWLLTPSLTLQNGAQLTFWTRTESSQAFADRLQVRMSTNGSSTNVGSSATDLGDFTTLLLDINPTYATSGYPNDWAQFTVNISGIGSPTAGRLAFRYFVENGGPSGINSDYIGIDTVNFNCSPTPTPTPTPTNTPTQTPTRTPTPNPLAGKSFFTIAPCRVLDTRNPIGPFGGPSLSGGTSRAFVLVNSCNVPATATAVSANITETQAQGSGHLRIYPAGSPLPDTAALNFSAGQTRANNAIFPLGSNGGISVYAGIGAGATVDLILDVNGYFQ